MSSSWAAGHTHRATRKNEAAQVPCRRRDENMHGAGGKSRERRCSIGTTDRNPRTALPRSGRAIRNLRTAVPRSGRPSEIYGACFFDRDHRQKFTDRDSSIVTTDRNSRTARSRPGTTDEIHGPPVLDRDHRQKFTEGDSFFGRRTSLFRGSATSWGSAIPGSGDPPEICGDRAPPRESAGKFAESASRIMSRPKDSRSQRGAMDRSPAPVHALAGISISPRRNADGPSKGGGTRSPRPRIRKSTSSSAGVSSFRRSSSHAARLRAASSRAS